VISRGALERLDGRERRAALAHEVAHVGRRDPLLGWVLMALRLALWFNPAVQIVARLVARELEWRADDLAAASTGDHEALASALTKLSGAPDAERRSARDRARAPWRSVDLFRRGRAAAVAARRTRLHRLEAPATRAFGTLRFGMTAVALALLLFFVV
jgi:Zn-dependent protease with chaperone function